MTIFFDPPRGCRFRRFKTTAHLYTDGTTDDLDAFAKRIGLKIKWRQHSGTSREHYDLFDGAIERARAAGAVAVDDWRHIVTVMQGKRTKGITP